MEVLKLGMTRLFKRARTQHIILGAMVALSLAACDPTKRVVEGQHLLMRNDVKLRQKVEGVDRVKIHEIIKQQPNRKILWMRIYLGLYNGPDPKKVREKRIERMDALDVKNKARLDKGKKPRSYRRTRKEWYREVVGEPPVIMDSVLTRNSKEQIHTYMLKEGYFDAVVTDSTRTRKKKAWVTYHVRPGKPTMIDSVKYTLKNDRMAGYIKQTGSPLENDLPKRFDVDDLEAERGRIETALKQKGYMYFSKKMVNYVVDTTLGKYNSSVELVMANTLGDSLTTEPAATVFDIDDVFLNLSRRGVLATDIPPDTTLRAGYIFLHVGKPVIKPKALLGAVFIKPNSRYKQNEIDNTYRRLTGLRLFDRVDMRYDTTNQGQKGLVDARIKLLAAKQQSFSVEPYGTNRGGFLGTAVSFNYDHKNIFRGMEALSVKLRVGLEAQQSVTGSVDQGDAASTNVVNDVLFNTVEIGPEVSLRFPSFLLPISRDKFARSASPRTTLSTLYNYQRRPDYTRTLATLSFGYEWNESPTKTWGVFPFEVNVIKISELSTDFRNYLEQANDPVLTDSYTDHLITGGRIYYKLNTQSSSRKRNIVYYRPYLETSGNLLRWLFNTTNKPLAMDTTGSEFFTLTGVRFAQYIKFDNDLRYYYKPHERSTFAFRFAAGAGFPLKNLDVLPFETSFFIGGANGLRAWRARSLGPGSYSEPLTTFDRIGEIRLEGNVEYRFDLVGFLEGAFFVDAGNIWMLNEDERRPGSAISSDLLSEVAIGTGIGARLDFDFFIVRFDLGLQTKDPSLPAGERWLFQPKDEYESRISDFTGKDFTYKPVVNFNLGIGYPF